MTATTKQKQLTAAEQYEQLKAEQFKRFLDESFSEESLKDVQLYEVPCPSGMTFKCRPVGLDFLRQSGTVPLDFVQSIVGKQADVERAFEAMNKAEKAEAIHATSQIVLYVAVEPRIILGVINGHRNAISTTQLTMGDYEAIAVWAKNFAEGGGSAAGLKSFRRKRK